MNNFTPRAQQILVLARNQVDRLNSDSIDTVHILLGIIELGQGVGVSALLRQGIDLSELGKEAGKLAGDPVENKDSRNIPYSSKVKKVLSQAGKQAKALQHSYVGSEHFLLGLLLIGDDTSALLEQAGITAESTRLEIQRELDPNYSDGTEEVEVASPPPVERFTADFLMPSPSRDLNFAAQNGKLHPTYGRENELQRLILCLGRKIRNCPVLLADPDVYPASLVYELVLRIEQGDVPDYLKSANIVYFDASAFSGISSKATELSNGSIKALIRNAYETENRILFIENIDLLCESSGEFSTKFRRGLVEGKLKCIGATTSGRFYQSTKQSRCASIFQPIKVVELSDDGDVINSIAPYIKRLADAHEVSISLETIAAAVEGCRPGVKGRPLPGPVFDLLDVAAVKVKNQAVEGDRELSVTVTDLQEVIEIWDHQLL